jgi:hypothetical protein
VQFRQSGNQHHGRIADREEHSFRFRIDDAPAWPSGKVNGPSPISLKSKNLKLRPVGVVPDTSDNGDLQGRNDRDAIRSWPGIQDRPGFQSAGIDPRQAGTAAVRDQDAASASNDACGFWKAAQRRNMLVSVNINHLKGVPSRVRNEDAAGLGFKSPMVK